MPAAGWIAAWSPHRRRFECFCTGLAFGSPAHRRVTGWRTRSHRETHNDRPLARPGRSAPAGPKL